MAVEEAHLLGLHVGMPHDACALCEKDKTIEQLKAGVTELDNDLCQLHEVAMEVIEERDEARAVARELYGYDGTDGGRDWSDIARENPWLEEGAGIDSDEEKEGE